MTGRHADNMDEELVTRRHGPDCFVRSIAIPALAAFRKSRIEMSKFNIDLALHGWLDTIVAMALPLRSPGQAVMAAPTRDTGRYS